MALVKNLNKTSNALNIKDKYTGLDYWKRHTKGNNSYPLCQACKCEKDYVFAEVGSHVVKVNSIDKNWYIVPLCKKCSKRVDEFNVCSEHLVKLR